MQLAHLTPPHPHFFRFPTPLNQRSTALLHSIQARSTHDLDHFPYVGSMCHQISTCSSEANHLNHFVQQALSPPERNDETRRPCQRFSVRYGSPSRYLEKEKHYLLFSRSVYNYDTPPWLEWSCLRLRIACSASAQLQNLKILYI